MRNTKGKTYEQIYGLEKAKELREMRRKSSINQMAIQRKGKSRVEIYGKDKALEINLKMSNMKGSKNPRFKGGRNTFICINCGISIKTDKYFVGDRERKFCSKKCFGDHHSKSIEYSCIICEKLFKRKKSWKNSKFCSIGCRNTSYSLSGNPNWKNGSSFEPYSVDWTSELRELVRKRDNYTCLSCGIIEKVHKIEYNRILTVHHIDYNKQNCNMLNLVTVCTKCNSLANGNRDYWFAYFRYILDGDSYGCKY